MKTYEVVIYYAGAVNVQVEAENDEEAYANAEQAFDEMSDADLIANLEDIHICNCWEIEGDIN